MGKNLEIYVGNVALSVNQDDLMNAFSDFTILHCKVLQGCGKKYSFLELDSEDSVRRALEEMNGYVLKGKNLVIRAGDRDLHEKLTKEIRHTRHAHTGKTRKDEDVDDGPPPLESCSPMRPSEEDCPPPLEPAIPLGPSEENCPPPLEPAFPKGLDDMPPPLEEVLTRDLEPEDSFLPKPVLQNGLDDMPPPLEEVLTRDLEPEDSFLPKPVLQNGAGKVSSLNSSPITLVVANFPFGTTEEDLIMLFKKFSPLKATVIVNTRLKDPDEKTYAYVTIPDQELAEQAITERDDFVFKNRNLLVTYVLERVH